MNWMLSGLLTSVVRLNVVFSDVAVLEADSQLRQGQVYRPVAVPRVLASLTGEVHRDDQVVDGLDLGYVAFAANSYASSPTLTDRVIFAVQHRVQLEGERAHVVRAGSVANLGNVRRRRGYPACPYP